MANSKNTTTTRDAVAITVGSVLAAALGAGIAALATRGGSSNKKTTTAGPRLKTKGCGGCGR